MAHRPSLAFLLTLCVACASARNPPPEGGAASDASPVTDRVAADASPAPDRTALPDGSPLDGPPMGAEGAAIDRGDASGELAPTDGAPSDTAGFDARPPENCALTEGIAAQWVYPSGRTGSLCAPLRGMGIGYDTQDCRPRATSANGSMPPVYFYMDAAGDFFRRPGPAQAGFLLRDPGSDCAMPDPVTMTCSYRRLDYMCPMEVTRPGRSGDVVEAVLTAPCRLLHDWGGPVSEVTLTAARVRGRLVYGGDINIGSHDGGTLADCGASP